MVIPVAHGSEILIFPLFDHGYINTPRHRRHFILQAASHLQSSTLLLKIPLFQTQPPTMRAFLGLFVAGLISAVSASFVLYPRQVPGYPGLCLSRAQRSSSD
jgi:hypothetical protein